MLLQEAADGGVALETDCDFVRGAGFGVCRQGPISTDVDFDWRWTGRPSLRRPLTVRTNPGKSAQ